MVLEIRAYVILREKIMHASGYVCIGGCVCDWTWKTSLISRLTVVSREAKKKQHARASSGLRDHYSELFTRMAALKFENAVTQPP